MGNTAEETRLVMRSVLRSVAVGGSSPEVLSKATCAALDKYQTLIKAFTCTKQTKGGNQLRRHMGCVFEVQTWCHGLNFPAGLMKAVFYKLYENDIIFEEGFIAWREDLSEDA